MSFIIVDHQNHHKSSKNLTVMKHYGAMLQGCDSSRSRI